VMFAAAAVALGAWAFSSSISADDKAAKPDEKKAETKEVTLKGTLVCASCALNEGKVCANVLQVKEKDKTINYYLADKGNEEGYHDKVCGGGKLEGVTVTGVVTEKDGKKTVKPSKVDYKK
jgi:hypothetical protein